MPRKTATKSEEVFSTVKPALAENKNSFLTFIILLVLIALVVLGISIFQRVSMKNTQNKLEEQITGLKNQLVDAGSEKANITNQINELQTKIEQLNKEQRKDKWFTYENADLDFGFTYPGTWVPAEAAVSGNILNLSFKSDDLNYGDRPTIYLLATPNLSAEEKPNYSGFADCALKYADAKEFCQDGCKKLASGLAMDYRLVNHGQPGLSAIGYSAISEKYPSVCLELDLTKVLTDRAQKENLTVEQLLEKYDVEDLLASKNIDAITEKLSNEFTTVMKSFVAK